MMSFKQVELFNKVLSLCVSISLSLHWISLLVHNLISLCLCFSFAFFRKSHLNRRKKQLKCLKSVLPSTHFLSLCLPLTRSLCLLIALQRDNFWKINNAMNKFGPSSALSLMKWCNEFINNNSRYGNIVLCVYVLRWKWLWLVHFGGKARWMRHADVLR